MDALRDIERVCSHPQSLAQCRELARRAPARRRAGARVEQRGGRAPRARRGGHRGDRRRGGGRGLRPQGAGRARSRTAPTTPRASWCSGASSSRRAARTARRCWSRSAHTDAPGALYRLLEPLARHRVSMTRIESRPSRRRKWDYVFFIDVEGHAEDRARRHGARGAQEARLAVPRARLLSAGGAVSAAGRCALSAVAAGGAIAGDTHRAGRQVDLAPRADARRHRRGRDAHQRVPRRRGLSGDRAGARARSACTSSGPARPRCACTAWARAVSRPPPARSTWATPARRCA